MIKFVYFTLENLLFRLIKFLLDSPTHVNSTQILHTESAISEYNNDLLPKKPSPKLQAYSTFLILLLISIFSFNVV